MEILLNGAPAHKRGTKKYAGYARGSKTGWYSKASFPASIPVDMSRALVKAANNSLTVGTWMSYGSINKHLKECQIATGRRLPFPMTHESVLTLLAYLFERTTLKAATINNLLSALRTAHLTKGHYVHVLRPDIVSSLLKGRANRDASETRRVEERLPVTVDILKMLRLILDLDKNMSEGYKLLIWSVSLMAFWGSLRVGEILSKTARTIDPEVDLLRKDVTITTKKVAGKVKEFLRVDLKSPKEARNNPVPITVEIFGTGDGLCPVRAYKAYVEKVGIVRLNSAAFRLPVSGQAYRHYRFNEDLKKLLGPYIRYGKVQGHSFRAGLATLMAAKGFNEEEIRGIGRWSSEAWLKYVKSGRVVRCRFSDKLAVAVRDEL